MATDNAYTGTEDDTNITGNVITDNSGSGIDTDVDASDTLSIPATGLTATTLNGVTVTLDSNGNFTYPLDTAINNSMSPTDSFTDSFVYTVTDGTLTDTALVTFTITGINDAPIAIDNTYTATEDVGFSFTQNVITDNTGAGVDSDPENDPISIEGGGASGTTSQGGTFCLQSDGVAVYSPGSAFQSLADGQTATDTFTYTITDGSLTDSAVVTIIVSGLNDAPVATDNSYTVADNATEITGNVISDNTGAGTDSDPEGDPLSIPATALTVTTSQGVTLTLGTDGSFTYPLDSNTNVTLSATESITDSVTYTVTDGTLTDTATVTFTVQGDNDAPTATDNTYTVADNATQITGNIISDNTGAGSDSDPEGDPLSIPATALTITTSQGVTLTLGTDGSFTYPLDSTTNVTLSTTESITDSFTYTVTDGTLTDTATVTFTIQGDNDAPTATANAYTEDNTATQVTGNIITDNTGAGTDSDPEGDSLSIPATALTVTTTQGVTLTLTTDGSFTYTTDTAALATLSGTETFTDSFAYTVSDGSLTDTATVTITITAPVNTVVAQDDNFTTIESNTLVGNVLNDNGNGTDFDPQGHSFTVTSTGTISTTGGGVVTLNADGTFDYDQQGAFATLATGATANDTFTYTITDQFGATDSATVTITIEGVTINSVVARDDSFTATENVNVVGNVFNDNGAGTDFDPQGDNFSVSNVGTFTTAAGGLATLTAAGGLVYSQENQFITLGNGATATDSISYSIVDDLGATDMATVTITITGVNTVIAEDDFYLLQIDDPDPVDLVSGNLFSNTGAGIDFDPENDAFSVSSTGTFTTGEGGVLTINANGTFTYDGSSRTLAGGGEGGTEEFIDDTFTYTIVDAFGATDSAVLTVRGFGTENELNALDDEFSTFEDQTVIGDVFDDNGNGPDNDPDGHSFSVINDGTLITSAGGVVTLDDNGEFTYNQQNQFASLGDGQTATDSFIYQISDSGFPQLTRSATVTITITGINEVVAADDDVVAFDNQVLTGNLFADNGGHGTDFDPEGNNFSISNTTPFVTGGGAAVSLNANGTFIYDPLNAFASLTSGATAQDTFVYSIIDDFGATDNATVMITISGLNDVIAEDDAFTVEVTANNLSDNVFDDNGNGSDVDPEGDSFSVQSPGTLATTSGGVVTLNANGTFDYDHQGQFATLGVGDTANDSFTYVIVDALGATDTATVTITVFNTTPPNSVVAVDDNFTQIEGNNLVGNLFANNGNGTDFDPEADSFSVQNPGTLLSSGGALITLNANGTFTYDQQDSFASLTAGATANDTFTYTIVDTGGATDSATVTVNLVGINEVIAEDDAFNTFASNILNDNVFDDNGNGPDSDPEGDSFSVQNTGTLITTGGGLVTLNANGSFNFDGSTGFLSLAAGATAQASFNYTIVDTTGATDSANVTITVTGENEVVAVDDDFAILDTSSGIIGNLFNDNGNGNDFDPESNPFSVSSIGTFSTSFGGVITISADGSFTYSLGQLVSSAGSGLQSAIALNTGQTANETFVYTIVDSLGASDTALFTVRVTGTDSPPVAVDDDFTALEGQTVTGDTDHDNGHGEDFDPEPSDFWITLPGPITSFKGGTVSLTTLGQFTYSQNGQFLSLAAGETTTDSFEYGIREFFGTRTSTATVTITITGVNDVVAEDDAFTVELTANDLNDNLFNDNGNGPDFDPEGDNFSVQNTGTLATSAGGVVTLNANGSFTYDQLGQFATLGVGATANDTFVYTVVDDFGATDTATVTITVYNTTPPNSVVAVNDAFTATEDVTITGGDLFANNGSGTDFDPQANNFSINSVGTFITAQGGLVTLNANGTFDYDQRGRFDSLGSGETASDSFTYTVIDDGSPAATDQATVTITITGVNEVVAQDDDIAAMENSIITDNVFDDNGNGPDYDPEGDSFSVQNTGTLSTSQGGVVTLNADGTFVYDQLNLFVTLANGASATDSFTYTITDGTATDTATVNLTINGVNSVVAVDDDVNVLEGNLLLGDVFLDNGNGTDFDPEGGSFSVNSTGSFITSEGGIVTLNANGSFSYNQEDQFASLTAGATATDSFTYTIIDTTGATDTAAVTVEVVGINSVVALDDGFNALEDTVISGNVLNDNGNGTDFDPEGDSFSVQNTGTVLTAQGGIVTLNANGSFDYNQNGQFALLAAGATTNDSFTYTIVDSLGATDAATATITITGINTVVALDDGGIIVDAGNSGGGNVFNDNGNGPDFDPEGNSFSVSSTGALTSAAGNPITMNSNGSFTYDENFNVFVLDGSTASDTFTYTIIDSLGATDTATVTLTINSGAIVNTVNAIADNFTAAENATVSGNLFANNGNGTDFDAQGDSFSVQNTGTLFTTAGGIVTLNANGTFDYEQQGQFASLAAGQTANDTFRYEIIDDGSPAATDSAEVTITITGTNDVVAEDDSFTILEDNLLVDNVFNDNGSGSDFDPEGDNFSVSTTGTIATTAGAIVTINANGDFTYDQQGTFDTLNSGETATDSFTYTIIDDLGATDTATVTMNIIGELDIRLSISDATGVSPTTFTETQISGGTFSLGSLNGSNGFSISGLLRHQSITGTVTAGNDAMGSADINNDGFSDLIVTNPSVSGSPSTQYIFYGSATQPATISYTSLTGTTGTQFSSFFTDPTAASAGDFNGDGLEDWIIGNATSGTATVLYGRTDTLTPFTAPFDPLGHPVANPGTGIRFSDGRRFGASAVGVGDVNGDGVDDILVGRQFGNDAMLIFGRDGGFASTSVSIGSLTAGVDYVDVDGGGGFSAPFFIGYTVSSVGDINNDGYDDIHLSADSNTPRSFIIFGRDTFSPSITLVPEAAAGRGISFISPTSVGDSQASALGDINGDGIDDVVIGSRRENEAIVLFGNENLGGEFDVSTLDGTNGFALNIFGGNFNLGISVSSAGDFNGDGFMDILVGAPDYRTAGEGGGPVTLGFAYLIFGKASGFDPTYTAANFDGIQGIRFDGVKRYTGDAVASAGDVNGDGYDDIMITSSDQGGNASTYIVYGFDNITGTRTVTFTISLNIASTEIVTVDYNSLDGTAISAVDYQPISGTVTFAPGETSKEITVELLAPVTTYDFNNPPQFNIQLSNPTVATIDDDTGVGTIYAATVVGDDTDNVLNGTAARDVLLGHDGDDTLDGLGDIDRLIGEAGDDTLIFDATDFTGAGYYDGGIGDDTLAVANVNGVTIDLTAIPNGLIQGIEVVDLHQTATGNSLTLNVQDVIDLSDEKSNYIFDGTTAFNEENTVLVNGDATDTVNSTGQGWVSNGTVTIDGVPYTHYSTDTANLLIENEILNQNIS